MATCKNPLRPRTPPSTAAFTKSYIYIRRYIPGTPFSKSYIYIYIYAGTPPEHPPTYDENKLLGSHGKPILLQILESPDGRISGQIRSASV